MKKLFPIILTLCLITVFLPLVFVSLGNRNVKIKVYDHLSGKVFKMDMEKYVMCAVAAEMPAFFEKEALKAQAVAARTYAAEKMSNTYHAPEHKGAHVCTNSNHCQAYKDIISENSPSAQKIRTAVRETSGEVATYMSKPIRAVFHSASHGATERSADVWGEDVAYLQSVESGGDLLCPDYNSEKAFTPSELCRALEIDVISFGEISRSGAGGVISMNIGGTIFKGTEARKRLGLRSTCFTICEKEGNVVFSVSGWGHGVGMSQWGAQGMAKDGADYKQILKHYYTGIDIQPFDK